MSDKPMCRDCADFGPICPNSGKPCPTPPPEGNATEQARLTEQQIWDWWASENGFEDHDLCKLNDFREFVRAVEEKLAATPTPPVEPVKEADLSAIRDAALEDAAKACEACDRGISTNANNAIRECAAAIRALRGRTA